MINRFGGQDASMKYSAGLVLVCSGTSDEADEPAVLLVHPGGPFWANKDDHAWSIPKGEYDPATESAWDTAQREFVEELGQAPPDGQATALPDYTANGKVIRAWMIDLRTTDPADLADFNTGLTSVGERSNTFEIEWPPRSGRQRSFPEVDAAAWFPLSTLTSKLHKGQAPLALSVAACLTS